MYVLHVCGCSQGPEEGVRTLHVILWGSGMSSFFLPVTGLKVRRKYSIYMLTAEKYQTQTLLIKVKKHVHTETYKCIQKTHVFT